MGKASRDKGKRGEREVVNLHKEAGIDARRTAQVDGGLSSDVLLTALPEVHVEVKRYSKIAACRFLEQAERDAAARAKLVGRPRRPVLFLREDSGDWCVMMRPEILMQLLKGEHLEK